MVMKKTDTLRGLYRFVLLSVVACSMVSVARAQSSQSEVSEHSVATNPFWHNWYVQLGADMSLQNPYVKC